MMKVFVFTVLIIFLLVGSEARAEPPEGFEVTRYAKLPFLSTDLEFAPDGHLWALDKKGGVWTLEDGKLGKEPVLNVKVSDERERGLLGMAFDPEFQKNGHFYLYYTTGPASKDFSGAPKNRLSRFTVEKFHHHRASPASELILIDNIASDAGVHNGGVVKIGPDKKLYMGTGDGGKRSQNAQDLSVLNGKILRVDLDGSAPEDNPFVGREDARGEIWAYGLRNPWRIAFDPGSGRLFAADVGGGKQEEVDVIEAGKNYGWPQTEGNDPPGVPGVTYPVHAYTERSKRGASITGGEVYMGSSFPPEYRGKYFFGDFVQNFMRTLAIGADGKAIVETFDPSLGWMIDITFGPDGAMYVSIGTSQTTGEIKRIAYTGVKAAPAVDAEFSVEPLSGVLPLTVSFEAEESPAGARWQYAWDFGDGEKGEGRTTRHVYTTKGVFTATLTVRDARGRSVQDEALIYAGNRALQVEITAPAEGARYRAGDIIGYEGNAQDPEDGKIPLSSFSWEIVFIHDEHPHPFLGAVTGQERGEFTVPRDGEADADVRYEIALTVKDKDGLETKAQRRIDPITTEVMLQSNPEGIELTIDGSPIKTPYTFRNVVNFPRTLSAPSTVYVEGKELRWQKWSQGGSREQVVSPGDAPVTYTAHYREAGRGGWQWMRWIGLGGLLLLGGAVMVGRAVRRN